MTRLPIVFSTDHNYVMPTCVTIHSLLTTSKPGISFDINIIIDPDVTEKDKEVLTLQISKDNKGSSINFIEIGDTFNKGFEIRDISRACYNRLMIPWLLPQYDKVVYSDVDIIFTGDISSLYNIDLGESLVAGVGGKTWTKGIICKYLKKIGAPTESYINSGFLLINSSLQRKEGLKEKYLDLSKRKFIYQDQDIINIVCKGLTHSQIPKGDGRNRWWFRPQFPMKNTRTRANGAPSRVTCSEVGPLNHMRISQTNMVRNLRNIWFDGGAHVARLSHLLGMISMVLM